MYCNSAWAWCFPSLPSERHCWQRWEWPYGRMGEPWVSSLLKRYNTCKLLFINHHYCLHQSTPSHAFVFHHPSLFFHSFFSFIICFACLLQWNPISLVLIDQRHCLLRTLVFILLIRFVEFKVFPSSKQLLCNTE